MTPTTRNRQRALPRRIVACGCAGALAGSVLTWLLYVGHIGETSFAGFQPPFGVVGLIAGLLIGGLAILSTSRTRARIGWCAIVAIALTLAACWGGGAALGRIDNGMLAWSMIWVTPIAIVVFPVIAVAFAVASRQTVRKAAIWMGLTAAVLTIADVIVVTFVS